MPLSSIELIRAREQVQRLLDDLQLAAYRFEVEPAEETWRIVIECASGTLWQTTTVQTSATALDGSDAEAERRLRQELDDRLRACREG